MVFVTQPPLESYLNWVPDPVPPPAQRPGDLTSPSPSENTPPQDASHKLPRRLWPRQRREKQPAIPANQNSASRMADPATPLGPSASRNSAHLGLSSATRPRSTTNRNSPLPGQQPGTSRSPMSASVKHPQTFLCPQHPQHPRLTANQNAKRRFGLDHPEIRGVYKPAQPSIHTITTPAFVETPSPDLASPHLLSSALHKTPSLDRPLATKQKVHY